MHSAPRRLLLAVVTSSIVAFGCGGAADPSAPAPASVRLPVVYGTDDRREYYEIEDEALRRIGRKRTLALVRSETLMAEGDEVRLDAPILSEKWGLCDEQRFAAEPAAAECSGFLVDERTVLTAGHCALALPCEDLLLVSSFFYPEEGASLRIRPRDVYACESIVVQAHSPRNAASRLDYAFLRLDRPVEGALPRVDVRGPDEPLVADEPLTLLGFSGGLPLKIDQGGRVVDPREATLDYFVSNLDAFAGDSGGPVLDSGHRLVGVVARGSSDYDPGDTPCNVAVVHPDEPGVGAEESTYAFQALDDLCRAEPETPYCCSTAGDCPAHADGASGCSIARAMVPRGTLPPPADTRGGWLIAMTTACALCRRTKRAAKARSPLCPRGSDGGRCRWYSSPTVRTGRR